MKQMGQQNCVLNGKFKSALRGSRTRVLSWGWKFFLALFAIGAQSAQADVAYISNQGFGITRIDLTTRIADAKLDLDHDDPRGIAISADGKRLYTANRGTGDIAVINTETMKVIKRIAIGKNPEFLKLSPNGLYLVVTYEPGSDGRPATASNVAAKKPAGKSLPTVETEPSIPGRIAVLSTRSEKVLRTMIGAVESEGVEFSENGREILITNEGEDSLSVFSLASGKHIKTVSIASFGQRPRGIKRSPDGTRYIVTLENSAKFLVLDINLAVQTSIQTAAGPYGVGFTPDGSALIVAAARAGVLQVFDAQQWGLRAEVPIGKRCWHFSFTPNGKQLLIACGRSDQVFVIDAEDWSVQEALNGFFMPWGIVTHPKASGSLDEAVGSGR